MCLSEAMTCKLSATGKQQKIKNSNYRGRNVTFFGKQLEVQQQLQNFLNIYKIVFINKGNK